MKIRVNPYLDQDTERKLRKLAISCETTKTDLAARIIRMAVNHPDIVDHLQDTFNKDLTYRVRPIIPIDRSKLIY